MLRNKKKIEYFGGNYTINLYKARYGFIQRQPVDNFWHYSIIVLNL